MFFFLLSQAATNNKCSMNISPPPAASICEEKCPSLTSLLHDEDKGGEGGGREGWERDFMHGRWGPSLGLGHDSKGNEMGFL